MGKFKFSLFIIFLLIILVQIEKVSLSRYDDTITTTKTTTTTTTKKSTTPTPTPTPPCASQGQSCGGGIKCCGDLRCDEGCKEVYVCCPEEAYCYDLNKRISYCGQSSSQTQSCYCTDSQGDKYEVGRCVSTTNPFCSTGWVRCVSWVGPNGLQCGWYCDSTCSGGSGSGSGGNIEILDISLSVTKNPAQRTDNQTIKVVVKINNNPVNNALVYVSISSPISLKTTLNCTTDQQGTCLFQYIIPSTLNLQQELGTWVVKANATTTDYKIARAETQFQVIECRNSQGCFCHEYCSNNKCVDLRPLMTGCMYYDGCFSTQDFYSGNPINNRDQCCTNGNCNTYYCANVDEAICEDQYYLCHGWFINCGDSSVQK